ncbi:hypothetical protein [Ketogulonicigenium vulgare]|uniref:Ribosomal protein L21 n=1 Tax=Ketogulonicigenium vulgare (strain WSH-001) TaxID=759362 RepID=F9Y972_KETVW|nr:hypothetical protein [Ketogulonicigenium vulgare]ADO41587.1 conserved hypothetical protein [Ketogulonicigenium vulgare Y25]AEM41289.1 Ribosomal protein L21 [Ketogulonicigenium vulgare WSH-001]ALJ81425.1 hypothetical protein KVH_09700 [Ketogulonicigenium vulgare]ANW34145.1 hypothetical protein KvSKV_09645 [Ketogulonicigenium vulgare]AOZ55022.1 hypothetical protein KVC_2015 [Ketogulonicigenium vulgare]
MWRNLFAATAFVLAAQSASAEVDQAKADALFEALLFPQITDVMARESTDFGLELSEGMTGLPPSAKWQEAVAAIHDRDWMMSQVRGDWYAALDGVDLDALLTFATTAPSREMLQLELAAREAMLADDVRDEAIEYAAVTIARKTPRAELIADLVARGDLVEMNVASALNSNLAFYRGMAEGEGDVTDDIILSEVMAQADDLRAGTVEWLYAFMLMAYAPVSDEDVQAFVAFGETDAGKALSRATTAAFDPMFEEISFNLGRAAAQLLASEAL